MVRVLWILMVVLATAPSTPAADISATVDRTSIGPGESIQLTVTSTGSDATVDTDPIRDFNIVSSGSSSNLQIVNGRMSRSVSYNYTLMQKRTGRLTVPRLAVLADGKTHRTAPIAITVSPRPQPERSGDALFLNARVSTSNPYEGEQLIYTFRFYHQVQVSNPRFQKPAFSGFAAKEVGDFRTYTSVHAGKRYTVSEIAYVLIPLRAGEVTIEPATLQCDVVKQRDRRRRSTFDSFFDDPFFGRGNLEPRILQTDRIALTVRPLPADSSNIPFSGLVGEFDISAHIDADTLNVGDSTTLTVAIEGRGNVMDAEEPITAVPDVFKVYKDSPEDDVQLTSDGYSGRKVFRTALVPIKAGQHTLPPIQLRYLDSPSGTYRVRSTPPILLTVLQTEEESLQVFSAAEMAVDTPRVKKRVTLTGRDILPLKENLDALTDRNPMSLTLFVLLLFGPALAYLGIRLTEKHFRKDRDPRAQMIDRASESLKMAERSRTGGSDSVFLTGLYRALVSTILSLAGVTGESLTYAEAEEILQHCGHDSDTAKHAATLLAQIESAKFSGSSMDDGTKQNLYSETQALCRRLV